MRALAVMLLLARCGRALVTPAAAAARRGRALSAAPTSFPLSSSKQVKVEYGGAASDYAGDLLLLPFWSDKDIDVGAATIAQGWDAAFGGALTELAESQEFKGKKGESHVLTVPGRLQGVRKVALVGLGPKDKALEGYAALGKAVAAIASKEKASSVGVAAPSRSRDAWTYGEHVEAVALATFEGCYVDDRFRTGDNVKNPPKLSSLELVDEPMSVDDVSPDDAYAASLEEGPQESVVSEAAERARAYAQGSAFAKDLVNAPPNILTPRTLAIAAVELAKEHATLDCTIKGPVECAALGMGAYLGVAQGASSDNEAQFIHLTYKRGVPKTKLCIVGKGLTYDSGGYNLKPSAGGMIELMKFDMGGAWRRVPFLPSTASTRPRESYGVVVITYASRRRRGDVRLRVGRRFTRSPRLRNSFHRRGLCGNQQCDGRAVGNRHRHAIEQASRR